MKLELLIIDPQVDFCLPTGALYVAGAEFDMERTAKLINRLDSKLDDIHVTIDSHRQMDIAHPAFWKDSSGKHPAPFTIITAQEVRDGKWVTTVSSY